MSDLSRRRRRRGAGRWHRASCPCGMTEHERAARARGARRPGGPTFLLLPRVGVLALTTPESCRTGGGRTWRRGLLLSWMGWEVVEMNILEGEEAAALAQERQVVRKGHGPGFLLPQLPTVNMPPSLQ
eukprot:767240-Hanusia_phi.AAC.5